MDILVSNKQAAGHVISLKRSDPRHMSGSRPESEKTTDDFGKLMMGELGKVNNLQKESLRLSEKMITDPDSVDAHDVTITLAEANMALNITKAVVDRVIRSYREITTAR